MLLLGQCVDLAFRSLCGATDSQIVSTFRHALPVIALAFSSFADQLASATSAEYALWSPGDSPVVRQKVRAPGTHCDEWAKFMYLTDRPV